MLPLESLAKDDDQSILDGAGLAAPSPAAREPDRAAGATLPTRKVPLGEELPVFCERCGYCLHGMAQHVCERCTVRQFHCPECGHHQPINTLRPAAQKVLGRVRAFCLSLSVLFKINFFGWLLFAWVAMGYEWSYEYQRVQTYGIRSGSAMAGPGPFASRYPLEGFGPRELDLGQMMAFGLFALSFGMCGRMFLLRWRRGYRVGLVLSVLVCVAVSLGAMWRKMSREREDLSLPLPFTTDFLICLAGAVVALTLGASIVWGIWTALAHVFLPKRTSEALLEWQRSQGNPSASFLARG